MTSTPTTGFTVTATLQILRDRASASYEDEGVDELRHALQAAQHARDAGADVELVVAALLHDIGRAPEVLARYGSGPHEEVGERFCREHISDRAASLVGGHVTAKRYLVATDAGYAATLSPASVRSLERQGGPMTPVEVHEFEADPHNLDAARLRRWDDAAKSSTRRTDPLESYERDLAEVWLTTTPEG